MYRVLKLTFLVLILTAGLTITGCARPAESFATPLPATRTPFQPLPPTATSSPTATITPTSTATPTETATATSLPTDTPAPVEVEPIQVDPEVVDSGSITVPILLYHHVSDTLQSQYSVTTDALAEQMEWLHNNGYTTINISDLAGLIREGGSIPGRPVVITFDDGYLDVYQNAFPILNQYGFVATFFIIGETVDTRSNISADQLSELIDNGWEIGSHSMHHTDLTQGIGWEEEIVSSKYYLENKLGVEIQTFAYPYGETDSSVINYTYNAGYTSAVGLGSSVTHNRSTLYYLSRKEVKSWYTLDFFEDFLPWSG